MSQSYHPPLYYLLMAPLLMMWPDSVAPIHFMSLLVSVVNLILIGWILRDERLIPRAGTRLIAFALACFLPQFVMFSSFISNDSLTLLVGTLMFIAAVAYARHPCGRKLTILALLVGIGLLTKGTFILSGPAMTLLVILVEWKRGPRRLVAALVWFIALWVIVGSYKYLQNEVYFGHPIVHNLDMGGPVAEQQRGVWKGWQTALDINVIKLIRRPILQVHNVYSIPLLMYATFWYPHIPDSTFLASIHGYGWVGSIMYAVAIVPTIVFIIGLIAAGFASVRALSASQRLQELRPMVLLISLLLFLSNLVVVLAAGIKYDIWSCFQSRLCFQSMVPILLLFGYGVSLLPPAARRIVQGMCCATLACCILYFVVEVSFIQGLLPAGAEVHP